MNIIKIHVNACSQPSIRTNIKCGTYSGIARQHLYNGINTNTYGSNFTINYDIKNAKIISIMQENNINSNHQFSLTLTKKDLKTIKENKKLYIKNTWLPLLDENHDINMSTSWILCDLAEDEANISKLFNKFVESISITYNMNAHGAINIRTNMK